MSKPHYTRAGSLGIAEVGRKIRASRSRLVESEELGDSARAWKIWAACQELTASWSKGSDRVHVVTIANLCNLRPDKVSPILRKFDELGIFGWTKEPGKRSAGILSLPSLGDPDVRFEPTAKQPQPTCTECGGKLHPQANGMVLCEHGHWQS